jgi:hypothetical protein
MIAPALRISLGETNDDSAGGMGLPSEGLSLDNMILPNDSLRLGTEAAAEGAWNIAETVTFGWAVVQPLCQTHRCPEARSPMSENPDMGHPIILGNQTWATRRAGQKRLMA